MSFDEEQHMHDGELGLAELFRSIWFYKFTILMFIVLSVPISIMFSSTLKPTYKAVTVFEKPVLTKKTRGSSLKDEAKGLGFLDIIGSGPIGGSTGSFDSEIRSESFLKTVILNNPDFDVNKLREFCPLPSKETRRFSLRSLLISLGISENRAPSESQKISLLVACVKRMIEINFDNYGKNKSSAYRLSIESGDPNFSANLANQIVEKFFVRHDKVIDQSLQNVKKYLSKVITEAQLELTEAIKLLQSFKFKNTLQMNFTSSSPGTTMSFNGNAISIPASPFALELNKEIASLSQLEKSLSQVKQARLNLLSLNKLDQEKIKAFIESTEVQGVLSRAFITAISKINSLSDATKEINQEIKKIVSWELINLKEQIQVLAEKIGKREEQTMQLMNIENRFQDLALDVAKKQLIFEELRDELKEEIISTGLQNSGQPVLLTKAVPPFGKASPNKRMIVILGIFLSIFVGIAYALIRQFSLRRVHSLSQLRRMGRFLNCYGIKYKELKQMAERSDETVMGQSFFSQTMGIGKLGCIIDLSQKRQKNSLASEFSKTIVNLLATDGSKIVCLDSSPSKKPFSSDTKKNFASDYTEFNVQGVLNKNISSFNDEDGMVSAGEINKIKNKYSDCDKIVCALGPEIGDLSKFKFIEKCDFYILIGRSFYFDEYTYKKFSNNVWEKEKKCIGFFLID